MIRSFRLLLKVEDIVTCEPYIVFQYQGVIRFTKHLASCHNKRVTSFTQ